MKRNGAVLFLFGGKPNVLNKNVSGKYVIFKHPTLLELLAEKS